VVVSSVADFLKRPDRLLAAIDTDRVAPNHFERAVTVAKRVADELASDDTSRRREIIAELVGRVAIGEGNVRIDLLKEEIASLTGLPFADGNDQVCTIDVSVQLRLRGVELKLVMVGGDRYRQPLPDAALIKVVARAHDWWGRLLTGAAASAEDIAREEKITRRYVNQVLPLAFLSPEITKSLLDGTQPVDLTAKTLSKGPSISVLWPEQLQPLGFDSP
jgi:site-specific DNA recombinase